MKLFVEDFLSILTVVPRTMLLALVILLGSMVIGGMLTAGKVSKQKIWRDLGKIYIWYVRGIPLIVHLFILYYLLPRGTSASLVLIITYIFYIAPWQSENIKSALNAVAKEQYEAAYCAGLTKIQTMRRIIVPQALTVYLPVSLNLFLNIMKCISVAFMVGVVDIMSQAKLCSALNFGYVEAYLAAAAVYWLLCLGLTAVSDYFENMYYEKRGQKV